MALFFKETRPALPVILCTGYSEKIDTKNARDAGINEFLYKPVDKDTLFRIVRKVLDEKIKKGDN